ncbi:MAG: antibiotic biosynthesis monooxygenase [Devosia sp.]
MTKVAIFPVFTIREGHLEDFLSRVREQRDDCLSKEPGCLHFDILQSENANEVALYEIYTDAEALVTHRTYDHYARFKAATDPWVESLQIGRYALVD